MLIFNLLFNTFITEILFTLGRYRSFNTYISLPSYIRRTFTKTCMSFGGCLMYVLWMSLIKFHDKNFLKMSHVRVMDVSNKVDNESFLNMSNVLGR